MSKDSEIMMHLFEKQNDKFRVLWNWSKYREFMNKKYKHPLMFLGNQLKSK